MIIIWSPKRKRILSISIALIVILGLSLAIYYLGKKRSNSSKKGINTPNVSELSHDGKSINALDGTEVPMANAKRIPLGIIIENQTDARPLFGLSRASLVYEALTEGGISRFLAIYGPYDAAKIGPVRSARTYYVDWIEELKGLLAHAGGAQNSLTKIVQDNIKDLPHNQSSYWREQNGKALEHTLFTATDKLYQYALNSHYDTAVNDYRAWQFKNDDVRIQGKTTNGALINFSDISYAVEWQYDSQTNSYSRYMGNQLEKDALNDETIQAKNIILMSVNRSAITSAGKTVYNMQTTGTGKAIILIDGVQIEGQWQKSKTTDRTIFYDLNKKEITFNRGRTWIEVINPDAVSYQFK